MGQWRAWLARAGLAALLLASLLITPLAAAQAAHLQLGHPDSRSASTGPDQHGVAGEHSHEHHHTVLHATATPAPSQQPKLLISFATFPIVPPDVDAGPAPRPVHLRDTGQPPQALLQVWRI